MPDFTAQIDLDVNGAVHTVEVQHHWTCCVCCGSRLALPAPSVAVTGESAARAPCCWTARQFILARCWLCRQWVGASRPWSPWGQRESARHQLAFLDNDGAQCGYCTPGFLLSAKALLDEHSEPTEEPDPAGAVGQPVQVQRVWAHYRIGEAGGGETVTANS